MITELTRRLIGTNGESMQWQQQVLEYWLPLLIPHLRNDSYRDPFTEEQTDEISDLIVSMQRMKLESSIDREQKIKQMIKRREELILYDLY